MMPTVQLYDLYGRQERVGELTVTETWMRRAKGLRLRGFQCGTGEGITIRVARDYQAETHYVARTASLERRGNHREVTGRGSTPSCDRLCFRAIRAKARDLAMLG
jgi:hypothetical protein